MRTNYSSLNIFLCLFVVIATLAAGFVGIFYLLELAFLHLDIHRLAILHGAGDTTATIMDFAVKYVFTLVCIIPLFVITFPYVGVLAEAILLRSGCRKIIYGPVFSDAPGKGTEATLHVALWVLWEKGQTEALYTALESIRNGKVAHLPAGTKIKFQSCLCSPAIMRRKFPYCISRDPKSLLEKLTAGIGMPMLMQTSMQLLCPLPRRFSRQRGPYFRRVWEFHVQPSA